jgi:DNA polymerase III subunit gamma/tau
MKWAPNKKLHFEVAIIKAIQSLGQATLDEVIEKLGELRDGKSTTAEKKTLSAASDTKSPSVGAGAKRPDTVSPASEKRAAKPPSPGFDVASMAAATLRVAEIANGETDLNKIWETAFAKIPNTKAFVRSSAAAAHVLPSEGRHFVLGFSPDQKSPMDILGTATNRKLIESLLQEVSGKEWTLKLTVQNDLPSRIKPTEDYADNPLIREALEIFKGEIRK